MVNRLAESGKKTMKLEPQEPQEPTVQGFRFLFLGISAQRFQSGDIAYDTKACTACRKFRHPKGSGQGETISNVMDGLKQLEEKFEAARLKGKLGLLTPVVVPWQGHGAWLASPCSSKCPVLNHAAMLVSTFKMCCVPSLNNGSSSHPCPGGGAWQFPRAAHAEVLGDSRLNDLARTEPVSSSQQLRPWNSLCKSGLDKFGDAHQTVQKRVLMPVSAVVNAISFIGRSLPEGQRVTSRAGYPILLRALNPNLVGCVFTDCIAPESPNKLRRPHLQPQANHVPVGVLVMVVVSATFEESVDHGIDLSPACRSQLSC